MINTQNNYSLLIQKLDEFIRKYHLNKLIKGLIYSFTLIIIFFLIITLSEYYFHFSTTVRKVLFYTFILLVFYIVYKWIIVSLLKLYHLRKSISHEQAARIIGVYFSNVADKLLNILQLRSLHSNRDDSDLIEASVNQKISSLGNISFHKVIDLSINKKYLKYLVPPLLIFIIILFSSPNLIKDSTKRLIYNNTHFQKKAPFTFNILNPKLETMQFNSFKLQVKLDGASIPSEIFIDIDNYHYKLSHDSTLYFSYSFKNLQKDVPFYLYAGGFRSADYKIKVLPKPMILSFNTHLSFPSYLQKEKETLKNIGDITVPEGTKVQWIFSSKNTSQIALQFSDSTYLAKRKGKQQFALNRYFYHGTSYQIYVSNESINRADSILYMLTVIPDQYPSIKVDELHDSVTTSHIYFIGEAADDYGIKNLYFKYKIDTAGNSSQNIDYQGIAIDIGSISNYSHFNYFIDIGDYGLHPGDLFQYYFEVWDNDGVNGSKSSRSNIMSYEMPTVEEFEKLTSKTNKDLKDDLEQTIEQSKALKEELESIQEKLIQKKALSWDDKKSIENAIKKQQQIQKNVEEIQNNFKNSISQQSDYKNISPEIAQKYNQLQKLFNELLSDEMKELFKELEALLDKINKDKAIEELEDVKINNEQLEEDLDRMLSLFKQLEYEQKISETIEKLKKLASNQEELSKKTKTEDLEKVTKKQDEINKDFEKVKEDFVKLDSLKKDINKANDELDKEQLQEKIEENLHNSSDKLQKNKRGDASKSQKKASDNMKKLSENMQSYLDQIQQNQMEVDLEAVRQLLENLINLSFDQEELIEKSKTTSINSSLFKELVKDQYKLKDNAKMIEDSLISLSKTVLEIESFVNKEVAAMNKKMVKSILDLEGRRTSHAAKNQQYVMTSVNNLALILTEVMLSLQEQLSKKMECKQNCQKPGKGAKSMSKLSEMQKDLNDQIKKMKRGMKGGKMPKQQMSKELAQMAARQAALREALRKLNEEFNKNGNNDMGNLDKVADEMEKSETDMVNKRITEELLNRQQEILTKLLFAAKAEKEREKDTKRESETGHKMTKKTPKEIDEYLKKRKQELELYRTLPPNLKPYYRDLVEKYFKSISF